jgi:hypothetical protein
MANHKWDQYTRTVPDIFWRCSFVTTQAYILVFRLFLYTHIGVPVEHQQPDFYPRSGIWNGGRLFLCEVCSSPEKIQTTQ